MTRRERRKSLQPRPYVLWRRVNWMEWPARWMVFGRYATAEEAQAQCVGDRKRWKIEVLEE
jgi:hypothetical protein